MRALGEGLLTRVDKVYFLDEGLIRGRRSAGRRKVFASRARAAYETGEFSNTPCRIPAERRARESRDPSVRAMLKDWVPGSHASRRRDDGSSSRHSRTG